MDIYIYMDGHQNANQLVLAGYSRLAMKNRVFLVHQQISSFVMKTEGQAVAWLSPQHVEESAT